LQFLKLYSFSKMKRTKNIFGVIGAGMIAQEHIRNLNLLTGDRIKWIAEINPVLGKKIAKNYNIRNWTSNYQKVLSDEEITAVIIATPPLTHLEIIKECVKSGKNILIEKPICINEQELDEFEAIVNSYPALIIMDASGRHSRLQPKYKKIKSIIDSGILGDIYYIHHNSVARQGRPGIEYHPKAKWFLDKKKSGGGPLLDWGVYDLSFHMGILSDKYSLIDAHGFLNSGLDLKNSETDIYNVEEHGAVYMQFDNKLKYYWERGAHANVEVPGETRIYGSRGGLKFSYITWESEKINHYYLDKNEKSKEKLIRVNMKAHESDHFELIAHFIDVLDKKSEPIISIQQAIKNLRIIYKIYASLTNLS
jgi:predicted dehydrogenase